MLLARRGVSGVEEAAGSEERVVGGGAGSAARARVSEAAEASARPEAVEVRKSRRVCMGRRSGESDGRSRGAARPKGEGRKKLGRRSGIVDAREGRGGANGGADGEIPKNRARVGDWDQRADRREANEAARSPSWLALISSQTLFRLFHIGDFCFPLQICIALRATNDELVICPNVMKNKSLVRVNFEFGILGLCILIGMVFVAAYYFFPTHREGIKFVGTALAASITIYTAYHVGISYEESLIRRRQESAYNFLELLNTADSVAVRDLLSSVADSAAAHKAQYDKIVADASVRQKVMQILGIFEDIAIAIETGYADEETLFRSIQQMVPRFYDGFYGYISELRRVHGRDAYYSEFEKLRVAWKTGVSLYDSRRRLTP
jgi:uncharacterized protein DUF4760